MRTTNKTAQMGKAATSQMRPQQQETPVAGKGPAACSGSFWLHFLSRVKRAITMEIWKQGKKQEQTEQNLKGI